jgi:hypothetical protein
MLFRRSYSILGAVVCACFTVFPNSSESKKTIARNGFCEVNLGMSAKAAGAHAGAPYERDICRYYERENYFRL